MTRPKGDPLIKCFNELLRKNSLARDDALAVVKRITSLLDVGYFESSIKYKINIIGYGGVGQHFYDTLNGMMKEYLPRIKNITLYQWQSQEIDKSGELNVNKQNLSDKLKQIRDVGGYSISTHTVPFFTMGECEKALNLYKEQPQIINFTIFSPRFNSTNVFNTLQNLEYSSKDKTVLLNDWGKKDGILDLSYTTINNKIKHYKKIKDKHFQAADKLHSQINAVLETRSALLCISPEKVDFDCKDFREEDHNRIDTIVSNLSKTLVYEQKGLKEILNELTEENPEKTLRKAFINDVLNNFTPSKQWGKFLASINYTGHALILSNPSDLVGQIFHNYNLDGGFQVLAMAHNDRMRAKYFLNDYIKVEVNDVHVAGLHNDSMALVSRDVEFSGENEYVELDDLLSSQEEKVFLKRNPRLIIRDGKEIVISSVLYKELEDRYNIEGYDREGEGELKKLWDELQKPKELYPVNIRDFKAIIAKGLHGHINNSDSQILRPYKKDKNQSTRKLDAEGLINVISRIDNDEDIKSLEKRVAGKGRKIDFLKVLFADEKLDWDDEKKQITTEVIDKNQIVKQLNDKFAKFGSEVEFTEIGSTKMTTVPAIFDLLKFILNCDVKDIESRLGTNTNFINTKRMAIPVEAESFVEYLSDEVQSKLFLDSLIIPRNILFKNTLPVSKYDFSDLLLHKISQSEQERIMGGIEFYCSLISKCYERELLDKPGKSLPDDLKNISIITTNKKNTEVVAYGLKPQRCLESPKIKESIHGNRLSKDKKSLLICTTENFGSGTEYVLNLFKERNKVFSHRVQDGIPVFDLTDENNIYFAVDNELFRLDNNQPKKLRDFNEDINELSAQQNGILVSSEGNLHLLKPNGKKQAIIKSSAEYLSNIKHIDNLFFGVDLDKMLYCLAKGKNEIKINCPRKKYDVKLKDGKILLARIAENKPQPYCEEYEDLSKESIERKVLLENKEIISRLETIHTLSFFNKYLFFSCSTKKQQHLFVFDEDMTLLGDSINFWNSNFSNIQYRGID